jgi:hypothetical protein
MWKILASGAAALLLASSQLAHAQAPYGQGPYPQAPYAADPAQRPSDADFKSFADRRIEVVKFALRLTPDQEKYWPAVEEAIRARAAARLARWQNLAARVNSQQETSPLDVLRARADALAERSAGLKKLADAWQPLYESLEPNQKQRLRFLAAYLFPAMRSAWESRRMQYEDEGEGDYSEW